MVTVFADQGMVDILPWKLFMISMVIANLHAVLLLVELMVTHMENTTSFSGNEKIEM